MSAPTRPKRRWRVLAIGATVCAVLSLATWGVGTRRSPSFELPLPGRQTAVVECWGGYVSASYAPTRAIMPGGVAQLVLSSIRKWWSPEWIAMGDGSRGIILPLWIPTAASALAALAFWRIDAAHHRRVRTGLCPTCGYDRAGLAGGAACPECGAAPAPASPPAP